MAFSSIPRRVGSRFGFRASPRATARVRTPQVASQLVASRRITPLTSHSLHVAITRVSKRRVYCDRASAHGAGTCFTPSTGQAVRGSRACT